MSEIRRIEICHGSNAGKAIYFSSEHGGTRVLGPKCYGWIRPIADIPMSKHDLKILIDNLCTEYMEWVE